MAGFQPVAKVDEVPEDRGLLVHVGGRNVALFRAGREVWAIDNACLHRGGPLAEGEVEGGVVTCPLHGWTYDLATGRCATNPAVAVRRYEVRVEEGVVAVQV